MRAGRFTRGRRGRVGLAVGVAAAALVLLPAGGVSAAAPALLAFQTKASPSISVGAGSIHDTAQIVGDVGLTKVTGNITFKLYGPDDTNCSKGAIRTDTVPVTGIDVDSPSFTPTLPGSYQSPTSRTSAARRMRWCRSRW